MRWRRRPSLATCGPSFTRPCRRPLTIAAQRTGVVAGPTVVRVGGEIDRGSAALGLAMDPARSADGTITRPSFTDLVGFAEIITLSAVPRIAAEVNALPITIDQPHLAERHNLTAVLLLHHRTDTADITLTGNPIPTGREATATVGQVAAHIGADPIAIGQPAGVARAQAAWVQLRGPGGQAGRGASSAPRTPPSRRRSVLRRVGR
jgi:hypothetical protein